MIDNESDMDDADNNDVVEKKEKGWITPKKHTAIEKSLKKHETELKKTENNNRHEWLINEEEEKMRVMTRN